MPRFAQRESRANVFLFYNPINQIIFSDMLKRLLTLAALCLTVGSAFALPAKRKVVVHRQSDGTELSVMLLGDEHFHYYATLDGIPLKKNADGDFCYASLTDGKLSASSLLAHNAALRTVSESKNLGDNTAVFTQIRSLGSDKRRAANAHRAERLDASSVQSARGKGGMVTTKSFFDDTNYVGSRKGLVILVNYKDKKMNSKHTRQAFDDLFNKEGYAENGNSGSVHDYFYRQSYGKFNLTFDVVGPVTVSGNMADYGANDPSTEDDVDPARMVYEACKLVDNQVNFADYDWDGDGEVDQVYVIYAGYGEASDLYGDNADAIWQHEWWLTEGGYNLTLDGVKIDTYGCSSELTGYSGSDLDGIGTAVHEFSHCMGLPDLYDTSSDGSAYGMDSWSVMDYGTYNGDGYVPAGYTSFERWVSGWLEPKELTKGCSVSEMKALTDKAEAYVIYNDADKNEFYLLENRQLKGDDASLEGHGLLVLHVDYDETAWTDNTMNNVASHQRCTVIAADNSYVGKNSYFNNNVAGDPYPGTSGNTELSNTSSPKASLYNKNTDGTKLMNKPVSDIAEASDGTVSFLFMGGIALDVPASLSSTNVGTTSFTANWGEVEGADIYNVQLKTPYTQGTPAESVISVDNFTSMGEGKKTDGTTDIGSSLDEYFSVTGWTGEKLYEGIGGLKMGSSKKTGYLQSPLFSAPESGKVTLRLTAHAYKSDNAGIAFALFNSSYEESGESSTTADGTAQIFHFDDVTDDFGLAIESTKRVYIDEIGLYDGEFSESDFAANAGGSSAVVATQSVGTDMCVGDTKYTFKDLTPNTQYQWRVRTLKGTAVSAWSDWQTVTTADPTGIAPVTLLPSFSNDTAVSVYTADGRLLGRTTYGSFLASPLYKGVYLLKNSTITVKVMK